MKALFLDIDGVLNGIDYQMTTAKEPPLIDPSRLLLVKEIVDKSSAIIVLSSSWKKAWEPNCEFDRVFQNAGITISDTTPVLGRKKDEILAWLTVHPEVKSFAILDDADEGWDELKSFVVVTDPIHARGLEKEHISQVLDLFNKKD